MGNPAGVARDFEALEKRRMKAVRLLEMAELSQSEIARRLKVCRQTGEQGGPMSITTAASKR